MALKDWKKVKPPTNSIKAKYTKIWINKKKNLGVVFEDWEHFGISSDLNFPYNIYVVKLGKGLEVKETVIDKAFKTKLQALKFAKQYMRTH